MNEIDRCNQFIIAKLLAAPAVTAIVGTAIYLDVAPLDANWPMVVFRPFQSFDTVANGGYRVLTQPLYQVAGVTKGDGMISSAALADAIDAALHSTSGAIDGAYVASCLRESTHNLTLVENGIEYRTLGGHYRLVVHAT